MSNELFQHPDIPQPSKHRRMLKIISIKEKNFKDVIQYKLELFLSQLSEEEIERFKSAEDLKQMIMNIAIIKSEDIEIPGLIFFKFRIF